MGKFSYESVVSVEFDDRLLAHLQLVIGAKVRRGESFHFTWKDDVSVGSGRTTVWIHPRCSVVYKFHDGRKPSINRTWIDALLYTANMPNGLYPVPEPPEPETTHGRSATPGAASGAASDVH
ncbi:ATP-dependent DNA ligase [Microbacterium sp. LRZ72]|uniref:DUF7882 family protein n=1 Tax=Microbacterium sp. LRZ72 TaxID=2942481 RepID=UPI0029A2D157|nr:ATP-dependent DNA ligase [Microbacterium sp. LRZ72]MDX2376716.1 ATP-dependent DNA ligase [Microbacterium sp. LRZ72]